MAEGLNASGIQVGAAAIAADIDHISLHTATPDATGSNLSAAGKVVVACTSAGGVVTIPQTAFTGGAANGAVVAVGYWHGTGTWRGYNNIDTGDVNFNAAGEYTLNASTIGGTST
jgi:hypothetical protein